MIIPSNLDDFSLYFFKLNADRERKKQKRRRKEKRKRRENLETVEHRRKDLDTSLTDKKPLQPLETVEFHFQHDSSENFQIIDRRKRIELHPNDQHYHGYGAKSFCACWVFSFHHSDIDLSELKKRMHQVISTKQIDIVQQILGCRPFCEFHSYGELKKGTKISELVWNWVPPPLDNPNTEFSDQQWLYDRRPLRNDTNQKTSAASNDHFCYPYTSLF